MIDISGYTNVIPSIDISGYTNRAISKYIENRHYFIVTLLYIAGDQIVAARRGVIFRLLL